MTGPTLPPSRPAGAVRVAPEPVGAASVRARGLPDPELLAVLALACPAVAGLSGGPLGSAATYLPGRTVPGIRVGDGAVEVHPVLAYGATVTELAVQVRRALAAHVGGRPVDIVVEDVQVPGDDPAAQPALAGTTAPPATTAPPVTSAVPGQVLDLETPAAAAAAADRALAPPVG